eukprot:CAMPEP_0180135306 /NCGR_PEP_ID=MMETSP0986-20121125/10755_1 /TAXON_ID=697907 /ORGANISM="non described non described, Strain CCMP2293" /LENGTH=53 /DNA_ID=CAMNT_0022075985 /DNA_START=283 /DNA_END=444 /DNA_ORIENTATION=-
MAPEQHGMGDSPNPPNPPNPARDLRDYSPSRGVRFAPTGGRESSPVWYPLTCQ